MKGGKHQIITNEDCRNKQNAVTLQRFSVHRLNSGKRFLGMNFLGLIIAVATFLVIGIFHPIVIKSEYHLGTRCWWVFLVAGVAFIVASLFTANDVLSPILGVVGCSCLWSILELFEQKKRVERGWFPMNPKREKEYSRKS